MKILFSFLIILLSLSVSTAQETFKIKDYINFSDGDGWRYKNLAPDGLSPIVINISGKQKYKGKTLYRRNENNGDYRLQKLDKEGLKIYQLYFVGERVIEYERAVLLIPADIKLNETHRSETPYQTFVKGELKEKGVQTYEVTAEEIEDVKTSFGEFKNSLVVRTVALRTDESGSQKGYELREWYDKDKGAVKITGELFWKNAKGDTTRTFKIDAELEVRYGISTSYRKDKKTLPETKLYQLK